MSLVWADRPWDMGQSGKHVGVQGLCMQAGLTPHWLQHLGELTLYLAGTVEKALEVGTQASKSKV